MWAQFFVCLFFMLFAHLNTSETGQTESESLQPVKAASVFQGGILKAEPAQTDRLGCSLPTAIIPMKH